MKLVIFNKRTNILAVTAVVILALLATVLLGIKSTMAENISQGATLESTGLENQYIKGGIIDFDEGVVDINGEKLKTYPKIYLPDGSAVVSTRLKTDLAGLYRAEYTVNHNKKMYRVSQNFTVYNPPVSVENGEGSISYGAFKYSDTVERSGLIAEINSGSRIRYNGILDLSDKTASDVLLDVDILPYEIGEVNARDLMVVLTDIHDASNTVSVSIKQGPSYGGNNPHIVAYVKATYGRNTFMGWQRGSLGELSNDQLFVGGIYGSSIKSSFTGYYWGDETKNIQLMIDAKNGTVHVGNPYTEGVYNTVINLFTDFAVPWKGFTTGEVSMTVHAERYATVKSRFIINSIYDENLSAEMLTPEEPPAPQVDFGEYSALEYPQASTGLPYKIFPVQNITRYGLEKLQTRVYYAYSSSLKHEIPLNNGYFTPDKDGTYTVEYTVTDRYGKTARTLVPVYSSSKTGSMGIEILNTGSYNSGYVGVPAEISPDYTVKNALGNWQINIAARHLASGKLVEITDGYFIPDGEGLWDIEYTATDYVGRKAEKSYAFNVATDDKPVFGSHSLPKYLIKGADNILPEIYAYDYNDGGRAVTAKISIHINGSVIPVEGNIYSPLLAGNAEIVYEAVSSVTNKKSSISFPVEIVDTGFGDSIRIENYFKTLSGGFLLEPQSNALNIETGNNGGELEFINILPFDSFQLTFNIDGVKNNTEKISVILQCAANPLKRVELDFIKDPITRTKVMFSVNGKDFGALEAALTFGGANTNFMLKFEGNKFTVNSSYFSVSEYYGGGAFDGFEDGGVYFKLKVHKGGSSSGSTKLVVRNLCGQPLSNQGEDEIAPKVYAKSNFLLHRLPGEEFTLFAAKSYDVLDPFTQTIMTVTDPNGDFVYSKDGIKLDKVSVSRDYVILLEKIGAYTIYYINRDSLGGDVYDEYSLNNNNNEFIFKLHVIDTVCPVVTPKKTEITVKKGNTVTLPSAEVTDNHSKNVSSYILVLAPDDTYIQVVDNKFTAAQKGVYRALYIAIDDAGNTATAVCVVKVN